MGTLKKALVIRPKLWYKYSMLDKQYIAGFFDGEGYIGLIPHYTHKNCYTCAIKIAQTEKGFIILEELKKQFGGYIYGRKHEGNQSDSFYWELKSKNYVKNFIEYILPYLKIKNKQAELILEYTNLPRIHKLYNNYDQVKMDRKHQIASEIKKLNHRGKLLATTE